MPYIDSTPKDYPRKFEEDNLMDVFGLMLTDNGWTRAVSFYKVAIDPRAYPSWQINGKVNYSIAKHSIFRNAEGILLGVAAVSSFEQSPRGYSDITEVPEDNKMRRINDELDPNDVNFQNPTPFENWVKQKFVENVSVGNLYFYQLEKLPNGSFVKDDGVIAIIGQPGMSGTMYNEDTDGHWGDSGAIPIDISEGSDTEMETDGNRLYSASRIYLTRAALDIEVFTTTLPKKDMGASNTEIVDTDPRVMQSPIAKTTLRADFLNHIQKPVWHTNWWTDSEVRVQGYVDSTTIFLTLQADNAPIWDNNLVPTIPLYFGKIKSLDGDKDEGYALFTGTIPGNVKVEGTRGWTSLTRGVGAETTTFFVKDADKLPVPPAILAIGKEIVTMSQKDGNMITVTRGQQDSQPLGYKDGTVISVASINNSKLTNGQKVAVYDFDDPDAVVGLTIFPLLKLYPGYPSNGVDSLMVSRSRFGARYQAHYLSWNAPTNQLPPIRMTGDGRKYPRAYESLENTMNYKYQFNASRYSGKIHSSRLFVIHPEEGVRGYLDKSIAFNPQSIRNTTLRVRKQDCPTPVFEMYKYQSLGAVSPLTKRPATAFRPAGLGIYSNDFDPNAEPHDIENDATPAGEVTITKVVSLKVQSIDIEWINPTDADFSHVDIYVDDVPYATGITGTNFYRIGGLTTGFNPKVVIKTVDLAGNESVGVTAETVQVV